MLDDNQSDAASHASPLPSHRTRSKVRGSHTLAGRPDVDIDARGDSDVRVTAASKEQIIKDWGFTDPVRTLRHIVASSQVGMFVAFSLSLSLCLSLSLSLSLSLCLNPFISHYTA